MKRRGGVIEAGRPPLPLRSLPSLIRRGGVKRRGGVIEAGRPPLPLRSLPSLSRRGLRGGEVPADFRQHALEVSHHILILKSEGANSRVPQETISLLITALCRVAVMRGTVQLDCHPFRGAIEVQHVRPRAMLTAKFPAFELAALQVLPQPRFRESQACPELATTCFEPREVVQVHGVKTSSPPRPLTTPALQATPPRLGGESHPGPTGHPSLPRRGGVKRRGGVTKEGRPPLPLRSLPSL